MDYNKFGFGPQGQVDPNRKLVSHFAHFMSMGGGDNTNWREWADKVYADMNKQGFFEGGKGGKNKDGQANSSKLVYNPNTGAFEPVSAGKKGAEKEGVLSQAMAPQQSSAAMYAPIQVPQNTMMMARMNTPSAPNMNPYNIQRYLDPRYRGGM